MIRKIWMLLFLVGSSILAMEAPEKELQKSERIPSPELAAVVASLSARQGTPVEETDIVDGNWRDTTQDVIEAIDGRYNFVVKSAELPSKKGKKGHVVGLLVVNDQDVIPNEKELFKSYQGFLQGHGIPGALGSTLHMIMLKLNTQMDENNPLILSGIIYNLYKKFGNAASTKIVTIAYGSNADTVNRATQLIKQGREEYLDRSITNPIDTLIYFNSPIYEYVWDMARGYSLQSAAVPTGFRRLFNVYSKDSPLGFWGIFYPDRKYRQQAYEAGNTLLMPVKNIRVVQINKENQLEDVPVAAFMDKDFIMQLVPLFEDTVRYKLNFDFITSILNAKLDMQRRPIPIINRFVHLDDSGALSITYGDSAGQSYIIRGRISDEQKKSLQRYFMSELTKSQFSLAGLLAQPSLDSWGLRSIVGSGLSRDIDRIKQSYTQVGLENQLYVPLTKMQLASPLLNSGVKDAFDEINKKVGLNPEFAYQEILKGADYARALWLGKGTIPQDNQEEYLNSIIALNWYLYSRTLAKNQPFTEGTFVIQDKDFKLYNFLMAYVKKFGDDIKGTVKDPSLKISYNPFAYPRESSHFKQEQKTYRQYGIDIRFGALASSLPLLPLLKRHLVFGKLSEEKSLIFIKCENFGLYYKDGLPQHGVEFIEAQGRKLYPSIIKGIEQAGLMSDELKEWAEEYLETDDAVHFRKERVPVQFIEDLKASWENFVLDDAVKKRVLKDAATQGIKVLYSLRDDADLKDNRWIQMGIQSLIKKYEQDPLYDYLIYRWGREVILPYSAIVDPLQSNQEKERSPEAAARG